MERNENGIIMPILAALVAAIVGGAIWVLIYVLTDYELGLVAWAIGGITGYAVAYTSKGHISPVHQIIAVLSSLLGILLGKYLILAHIVNGGFDGLFDPYVFEIFKENFSVLFEVIDIIFVLFAVLTAWRIPARFNKSEQAPASEEDAS